MGGYEKKTVDNKELGMGKVETTIEGRAEKWRHGFVAQLQMVVSPPLYPYKNAIGPHSWRFMFLRSIRCLATQTLPPIKHFCSCWGVGAVCAVMMTIRWWADLYGRNVRLVSYKAILIDYRMWPSQATAGFLLKNTDITCDICNSLPLM